MKLFLMLLAIVLIAAGVAVGLLNVFSPGSVTVGLNLDVAATLFTGGCVLLGLGLVAGNLAALINDRRDSRPASGVARLPAADADDDLPDFLSPASAAAAGAAAAGVAATVAIAEEKTEAFRDTVDDVGELAETATDTADSVFDAIPEFVESATEAAGETASPDVDAAIGKTEELRDDLSSLFDHTPDVAAVTDTAKDEVEEKAHEAVETARQAVPDFGKPRGTIADKADDIADNAKDFAGDAVKALKDVAQDVTGGALTAGDTQQADEEAAEESDEALPQEDALFVVEERIIRERPARLLSDGTVEAETDEGWMRFENVEHVEEYLDAMKATA